MSHPFAKQFERALKKCTVHDNCVLTEARKLLKKGYRIEEIDSVLKALSSGRIDDRECEILEEVRKELSDGMSDE